MKNLLLLCLLFPLAIPAQYSSIMQEELQYYNDHPELAVPTPAPSPGGARNNCNLQKMVFGWHPYWSNGLEVNYAWNLLSDLSYFSYEVNAANGQALSTHSWSTAPVIDTALAHGVRVNLCVTLFSGHATFFGNPSAQTTLINNLLSLVQSRNANGVNIDFEGLPAAQSAAFTNFMIALCNAFHQADPNYQVSVCLYSVDWSNVFDEPALAPYVDYFTIMGYDYYYSGSTQAGPTDPLYGFTNTYDRSLSRSVTYYVNAGIPPAQLILGLPYYGREWETTSNTIPGSTTGNNVFSRTYAFVQNNSSGFYTNPVLNIRSNSFSYIFQNSGTWRQCWINGAATYKARYDFIKIRSLAGIGIWALGYDDGYAELWDAIEDELTDCGTEPCSDTIYDGGGPLVDYYDTENYTFTIAPANASQVHLNFTAFATEANFDTLWIFDGPTINAPLIGAYHGNNSPGNINSSGGDITLRFRSDGNNRAAGWELVYTCTQDNVNPGTSILPGNNWETADFYAGFNDSDNVGITTAFYQVKDLNNNDRRANPVRGFLADAFDLPAIHAEWTNGSGNWQIANNVLEQTDENNTNTNLYASLNETLSDEYLYHFQMNISGTGNNRRGGFHYFCDSASLPNRGNGYFVWFRVDQSRLQFYKVTNDVFTLTYELPMTVNSGQWYDYKIMYNRLTGKTTVYQDGIYIGEWTDPNPYSTGKYISFRSGNANIKANNLDVYRSRPEDAQELVKVGNCTQCDLRYQNPNPVTEAGQIQSIVVDSAGNLSAIDTKNLNIDWTPPSGGDSLLITPPFYYCDLSPQLIRWTGFSDTNSGIADRYWGIGNLPGADDIFPFTSLTADSVYITSNELPLYTPGYVSVFSMNAAGLTSDTSTYGSYMFFCTGTETEKNLVQIFPNPVTTGFYIIAAENINFQMLDMTGKIIYTGTLEKAQPLWMSMTAYASGFYMITAGNRTYRILKP